MKKRNLLTISLVLLFLLAGNFAAVYQHADGGEAPLAELVTVTSICAGTTVPPGWAVVNITAESFRCGVQTQSIPQVWNVWYIENLNPYPNGTLVSICRPQNPPTGWIVREILSLSNVCGVVTNSIPAIYNVQIIERVSGGPTPTPTIATPTPNRTPIGYFDYIHGGTAFGWALDPDTPTTNVTLHAYIDGPAGSGQFVNVQPKTYIPRPDVNQQTGYPGNHGFTFAIPRQYYDGQNHTMYIYAIDTRTGAALLTGSPKTFNLSSGSPMGKFESVGADRIARGWTLDPSNPGASNAVAFYIDGIEGVGTYAGSANAGTPRPDVNQSTGLPGNHGFEFAIPPQFHNGQNHTIYAYGLDLNGDPKILLQDSPKIFNFPPIVTSSRTAYDFNGDGRSDQTVFRSGVWHHNLSPANVHTAVSFGVSTDKLVPADYDGDGKTDLAIFRNDNGLASWWILKSATNQAFSMSFGFATDIPVPADYDGDGKADIAIFRNDGASGTWWVFQSSNSQTLAASFGVGTDKPVPADYDGDGKADFAINRIIDSSLVWLMQRTTAGYLGVQFGISTDKPVQADYDGDGKADVAVFRSGYWYIQKSRDGFFVTQFGVGTDTPTPADYDGDGKTDVAIFRNDNNSGVWWTLRSTDSQAAAFGFGLGTDLPVNGQKPQ